MYTLNLDSKKTFTCKLRVEGTSLRKAFSRLILESQGINLMYNGTIDKDGNCKVEIKNLSHIFNESDTGNIKFEVIADDVYFSPWKDTFNLKKSKSVMVENVTFESDIKPSINIKFPFGRTAIYEYLSEVKNNFKSLKELNRKQNKLNEIAHRIYAKYDVTEEDKAKLINATLRLLASK